MARQAKKENTENLDAAGNPGVTENTGTPENTAENIVPNAGDAGVAEQNTPESPVDTEEASTQADDSASGEHPRSRASGVAANGGSGDASPDGGLGAAPPIEPDHSADAPTLESLAVLADRHRVPGWQQAALMRMMGWDDGKAVSDEEYRDALEKLRNRRLGGGRLA